MTRSHTLASYVPRLIYNRIKAGSFDAEPRLISEDAALLLGDIKGSTGIVERVGRQGALAFETLTANLSKLFSDFIEEVYAADGDVLFIAGDAFLCYWPVDDTHNLADVVNRAAHAGLRIQQKLLGRDDGFGNELIFRIGIGAGRLNRAFVGGELGRWELVLSGDVFDQVAAAEKQATPGRVLASPKAWELLQKDFDGDRHVQGVELQPASTVDETPRSASETPDFELSDARLEAFVPPSVARRQIAAEHSWLSEFRHVSVLMVDLPSLGMASAEDITPIHQSVQAFQSVAAKFEGSIKVDVDDKGIMLLAVFGLPPMAHENDAARAIHAAWELQTKLREIDVHCGTGIASGRALCAPLGNNQRREYMVRGDVINRAARLMNATSSEIACDETTSRATREDIEFEALPHHMLKGLSEAVGVHRPIGTRHAFKREPRQLIGRSEELQELQSHLTSIIAEQRTGTVIIEGDAGLGKTSLVDEFARRAANQGARVLRAQADAIERSSPLHAWRSIFSNLFGLTEGADLVTRRERVLERMSRYPELEELTPLLSTVVGMVFEDNDATAHLQGDIRAAGVQALLANILQKVIVTAPCVLLIEDAQWFDSRSWDLLVDVANGAGCSCIVIATRPSEEAFPDWAALRSAQTMHLTGFNREEISRLIARRIGVQQIPEELMEIVQTRAGGNPFFSEEIVRAMIDDGVLSAEQGVCRLNNVETFTIPPNIEGMVLSRIDRLPERELLLIKMASIVGQTFPADAVLHITPVGIEEADASTAFNNLVGAGFLDELGSKEGHLFQFRHVIMRDVTYATLAGSQRGLGHAAYATWLEDSDDLNPANYPLLAHHWREAGELERALGFFEQAGEHALRDGGFPEALLFFEQAHSTAESLALDMTSKRAASWLKGIGTAHYFLGEMDLSRKCIEACVAILDKSIPANRLVVFSGLAVGLMSQLWHRGRSRGNDLSTVDKSYYDMAVDSYKMLGQLYFLEGEAAELLAYLTMRGLNVGELAGPSNALACILTNMSFTAGLAGLDKPSNWYASRAIAMTETGGQRGAAAYVWHIDALRHAQHGDWQRALAANDRARTQMIELGDFTLATEVAAVRSALILCSGDLVAAVPTVTSALELAQENNNEQYCCWALLDEAEIALARDQVEEAERLVERAFAIETEAIDMSSTLDKQRAIATIRLRQARIDEALSAADEVCKLIASSPPTSYYFLDFFASAVEVYVSALSERPDDRDLVRKTQVELKRLKTLSRTFWNVKSRYWLLKGLANTATGHDGSAAFTKARDLAVSLDCTYDEARALTAIAASNPSDRAARDRAVEIFTALGRSYDLAQVRALSS